MAQPASALGSGCHCRTITGGIGIGIGALVWAGASFKHYLDGRSQNELQVQTPVSNHTYKLGQQETDIRESVSDHIRRQQLLQQKDLTQPAHSYDAAPQANEITFAPAEAVRQPTKQEMAPSAHRQAEKDSRLFMDQGQAQIPVQLDVRATTPGGSVSVDAVSAEELKQHLAAAEKFLTEKARQENAAGNTDFAQELLADAQYTGECIKTLGQCTLAQLDETRIELFKNSPLYPILQDVLHLHKPTRERTLALTEPRYKGIVQECCAKAGKPLAELITTLCTYKLGSLANGTIPPQNSAPKPASEGVAVATGADTVAGTTQAVQADKITASMALMAGKQGSDEIGSHGQAPQKQAQTRTNEKIELKTAPATEKAALTEVARALKCDESSALSMLKSYIEKGTATDNRIETMINADAKILFRKDFGKNAHALTPKRGYPKGVKIDHYNIEIQTREHPGTTIDRWNDSLANYHIVVDETGKVTDMYKTP